MQVEVVVLRGLKEYPSLSQSLVWNLPKGCGFQDMGVHKRSSPYPILKAALQKVDVTVSIVKTLDLFWGVVGRMLQLSLR